MNALHKMLQERQKLIGDIRQFFQERHILEVETPFLAPSAIPDPYVENYELHDGSKTLFLQTSPELHMKRLIAAGVGSCYQIARVFRRDEAGTIHHPEFSMLEWYRLGFDHYQLMEEVDSLVQQVTHLQPAVKMSYKDVFKEFLEIDPHHASTADLEKITKHKKINAIGTNWSRDEYLDLLFSHCIEPELKAFSKPVFVYHFPKSKAALSRLIQVEDEEVAARFELFIHGIEIANGFYELCDAKEQLKRFEQANIIRHGLGLKEMPIDARFINAVGNMPDCSGVALGLDRLLMMALKKQHIDEVMAFSFADI